MYLPSGPLKSLRSFPFNWGFVACITILHDKSFTNKSGSSRWFNVNAKKIVFQSNPAILATVYDITDRKFAEEESLKHIEELRADRDLIEQNAGELAYLTNKLVGSETQLKKLNSDKDKFFSLLSHDLRSPFHIIIGCAGILNSEINYLSRNDIKQMSGSILSSAINYMNLLNSLLEWSKIQIGSFSINPSEINLNKFVADIFSIVRESAYNKTISLIANISTGMELFSDKQILQSIIQNMLTNAIKFTKPNGLIIVTAEKAEEEIRISITDNGIGLEKENLKILLIKKTKFFH